MATNYIKLKGEGEAYGKLVVFLAVRIVIQKIDFNSD
jgi:hypothetical protein